MWSCLEPVSTIDESIVGEFCTNGLLRIKSEKTVIKTPNISGILQNGRLIISIDNALILYPDEKRCNDGNFLEVTHSVEAIAVSTSGNIVVSGLFDGTILVLHISGITLFSFKIDASDTADEEGGVTFAGISDEGNGSYLIQAARGSLYRVTVDEAMIAHQLATISPEQQDSLAGLLPNCASCDRLVGRRFKEAINCFIPMRQAELFASPLIAAANNEMVYFIRDESLERVMLKPEYGGVKKMYSLMNLNFALTNNGQIFEICPFTKLTSELPYTFRIDDLVILEASLDVIEMLIITKADTEGRKLMKIVNFPSMELKQEMEMSENTWLVQQPKNSANIYYIVGHSHREPVVQEIELKILSETDPSQRLVKLIKIGRLDEAEMFACQFELDVQLVHQARAKALLGELSTSGDIETTFAKLMAALANVNDHAFLVNIRDAPICDRNMKKRFLQFLLTKLTATEGPEMESIIEINERMLRIETLKLIDPNNIDQDWQQFVYHDNLPQLCTELFQKDMDAACLIWSRHIACILPQLDEVKVSALLGRIPKETSPLHLVQWLLHFVSPILHHHPQMMHLLVEYIIEKTKSFQKLATWPMVGLTFIEDVIKILEDVQFPLIDLRLQYNSNMDELQRLASALRDLVTLKQQFNLQASLDCYMQEDIESTAVRLLQITPLNLLGRIVTEFLCKFFVGKESSLYEQIVRYIRFLLANQYSSFWDQRCITLVELLYDEQQQMETVLAILNAAPVPWSPTIASLMKYAACDHPIAEEIVMAQNSQTIKCLQMKYGWSVKAPYNPRLLVQRVLKLHTPEMLTDIETIVRITPTLAFSTDLNVITKLAEAGEGIVAARYLDGLEETRKAACCQSAIGMMIRMVDAGAIPNTLAMAYLETLQMLKYRADPEQQKAIQQIVHIMQLRNEFGLTVNPQALADTTSRKELLLSGIRFILSKIQHKPDQFLDLLIGSVRRLSSYLGYNLLDSLYEVMLMLDDVHMSCLLAAQLPELTDLRQTGAFQPIHRIVSLLLAQQIHLLHDARSSSWIEDPLTFPICRELLYQSASECTKDAQIRLELLRWIHIGVRFYPMGVLELALQKRTVVPDPILTNIYEKLANETDRPNGLTAINGNGYPVGKGKRESLSTFDVVNEGFDHITVPQIQQVQEQETINRCIGLALQLVLCRLKPKNVTSPDNRTTFGPLLRLMDGPLLEETMVAGVFQTSLDHLIRAKQYPPVVALVHLLMSYQHTVGLMMPIPYVESVYRKAIKYMLSQKEANFSSAIMTLFTCQNREACLEYLRNNLINESQRVALHALLEFYYFTIGQEAKSVEERKERQRYTLFHELCRLDPSLKAKKSFVFHSQADLMKELKHKVIGVDLLRKMSDAFNWEYQQMLVSQILTFFGQQEPSFTVQTDTYGREKVIILDKPEAMMARLSPYLAEVENAVMLCSKLTKYMEHANGYFYEQFFCIFDILAQFGDVSDEIRMCRNILMFMKEHLTGRRRQRPGQLEQEAWMREHPDGDMLPEIAKYRYPFMLIVRQPLKLLLKEEIAIDNYQKLLLLVEMKSALEGFDCNEMNDNFCKSAVVNSINEYKIQNKEMTLANNDWHRQAKNKAFLQSILRIVDSIKDLSSRLLILYYITCNASDGDDQVNAAYACYQFARKHEAELANIPEAKEKLEKIFRKYPMLKTQQLLQQNGVTEEKQFQLVRNPHELIMALYSDSCFQQVKVNELVSVIGELYELDIEAIQMQLLQKWLTIFGGTSAENSTGMLEETLYDDHNMSDASQEDEEGVHDYMKRAYYILNSWERSKSVEFLVAQLNTSTDGVSSDVGKQLHIYACFSKLVDDQCNPYQTFFTQQRYVALKCVHLLKSLGLGNLSIAKFEETDKMALLKMLWQSHATNPKGLEVIALICIGYNIYLPQIWNGILKQMARLGMVANLRALIDIVTAKRQLFGLEGYRMAWELLIKEPFRSASREQSLAEDAMLARSLVMMQRCPISFRLNLLEIADVCVNVNRVNMAAVLIGFADSEQRESLKKLIANNVVPNLKDQIQELEEFGLVTTVTKAVCSELTLHGVPLQNGTSKRRTH